MREPMSMSIRIIFLSCIALVSLAISGCGSSVLVPVKPSEKDPLFTYDGNYIAKIQSRGGRQEMGNGWYNNCPAQDFTNSVVVENSEVLWQWTKDTVLRGFVDRNGRFRLEHKPESTARATNTTMSDGTRTTILQGVLHHKTMSGRLIFGIAQFNNRGCTYTIDYTSTS